MNQESLSCEEIRKLYHKCMKEREDSFDMCYPFFSKMIWCTLDK